MSIAPTSRAVGALALIALAACSSLREGPLDAGSSVQDRSIEEERLIDPDVGTPPDRVAVEDVPAPDARTTFDSTTGADSSLRRDVVESSDQGTPMDASSSPDMPMPVDAGAPTLDAGPDASLADVSVSDAAVASGVYDFTAVATGTLTSQVVAAAWHPSGRYALILPESNKVYRYTPSDDSLAEVGALGTTIFWQAIAFTPDGAYAVLASSAFAQPNGRLFRWNDADSSIVSGSGATDSQYVAVGYASDGTRGVLLGQSSSMTTLWNMNLDGTRGTVLASHATLGFTARCATLAWVTDAFGDPAVMVGCAAQFGILAATELSGSAQFNEVVPTSQTGALGGMGGRPQRDLALAVGGSTGRVFRYFRGAWAAGVSSPNVMGATGVSFNADGTRALIFGGYGYLGEYRYNLYAASAITQFRLPLADAPYSQPSNAIATAVAWRPGCDGGIIVGGGTQSSGHPSALFARFSVRNGRPCVP